MNNWTATGRQRHRSQRRWGDREELVLQVEERGLVTYWSAGTIDSDWATRWRDASTSDLTILDRARPDDEPPPFEHESRP